MVCLNAEVFVRLILMKAATPVQSGWYPYLERPVAYFALYEYLYLRSFLSFFVFFSLVILLIQFTNK